MKHRQAHPWFKDVVWDKLYEMEAAFKPEVNGELDTQNFMKFDEVKVLPPLIIGKRPLAVCLYLTFNLMYLF